MVGFFLVANDYVPDKLFVGLWPSYNWTWSGPGEALLSDVNKAKEKTEKKKNQAEHPRAVIMAGR